MSNVQDIIKVEPRQFSKPSAKAILDQINVKYSNKVRTPHCRFANTDRSCKMLDCVFAYMTYFNLVRDVSDGGMVVYIIRLCFA